MRGNGVEVVFSTMYRRIRAVCARVGLRFVLFMNCEFFVTG